MRWGCAMSDDPQTTAKSVMTALNILVDALEEISDEPPLERVDDLARDLIAEILDLPEPDWAKLDEAVKKVRHHVNQ